MAQPRNEYCLGYYLTDKWPDDAAILEIDKLGDETAITEELYDKYVHWDENNKNPKPKWSEIKDDFLATRTAELKKLSEFNLMSTAISIIEPLITETSLDCSNGGN